jgi:hypothetical protein
MLVSWVHLSLTDPRCGLVPAPSGRPLRTLLLSTLLFERVSPQSPPYGDGAGSEGSMCGCSLKANGAGRSGGQVAKPPYGKHASREDGQLTSSCCCLSRRPWLGSEPSTQPWTSFRIGHWCERPVAPPMPVRVDEAVGSKSPPGAVQLTPASARFQVVSQDPDPDLRVVGVLELDRQAAAAGGRAGARPPSEGGALQDLTAASKGLTDILSAPTTASPSRGSLQSEVNNSHDKQERGQIYRHR